jgi:ligand-binding SRPBCC domain-containing protein
MDTHVPAAFGLVRDNFNEKLFTYLLPPGARLIRYDGSSPGDIVHLTLPIAGEWKSEIVESGQGNQEFYFIDIGHVLPMGLKFWKHRHELKGVGTETLIRDDMTFSTGNHVLDGLLYPIMYMAFLPRKQQYRKFFTTVVNQA